MHIAVLFDMDGVIVDSNPYHKLAFQAFLAQYHIALTDEELKTKVYGRTNKEIMSYIFKENATQEQSDSWANEKEALFRKMYQPDIRATKGLTALLQALKVKQIPTAVGTSAPLDNLNFVLDALNLRQYFDVLLHSKDVVHGKPAPEIYLKAANKLGMDPSKCIVIEDSLPGIQAGLSAGMKVIGITTTHTPEELQHTHFVIQDFRTLNIDILQALF